MAIIGAARLANALQQHGGDHATAFLDYHAKLCGYVDEVQQKAVIQGMAVMFPSSDAELTERNRKLGDGTMAL